MSAIGSTPSGGQEMSVTLRGDGARSLFERLAASSSSSSPGSKSRHTTWQSADILVADRQGHTTWVGLFGSDIVMATSEDALHRGLTTHKNELLREEVDAPDPLMSLMFRGGALADILNGRQLFRANALNSVKALQVTVGADGSRLMAG